MKNQNQIPDPIKNALDQVAIEYNRSAATTNAGRWLRFISRLFPPSAIIKIFAHKLSK